MRRFVAYGPAFVVLMAIVAMLTAAPAVVRRMETAQTEGRIILARQALEDDDVLERINHAVTAVADSVRPSIVHLDVRGRAGPRGSMSAGTGWVYDDAGHIVTNAHVLFGARWITVNFSDGRTARAEMVGEPDPYTDIAVIKVPASERVFPAQRATGVQPRQGERVFAFGSPFGFRFSMSQGIISGLGRDPRTAMDFQGFTNFIQTDAAVNPGNSGGPLVDIKGRVIGMNVAIATGQNSQGTTEGQSAGISFAIPLTTIESVVDQIIENGSVSRGFLGITWTPGRDVRFNDSVGSMGIRLESVEPNGPAAKAGLRSGDFVTEVADQAVTGDGVLRSVITSFRPGKAIKVKAWRDGQTREYDVVLGEYPRERLNIDGALAALESYGLALGRERAFVAEITSDSSAARAGFEEGQRITKVADKDVSTSIEALNALAESGLLIGRRVPVVVSSLNQSGQLSERTIDVQLSR